jgi:hypothetical protein
MARRGRLPLALGALLVASAPVGAQEAGIPPAVVRQALIEALTPALPYPRAAADGIPESGDAAPRWSVHWPEDGDEARVEVMANPLNAETQKRAAMAEKEAQSAVIRAQRKSQSDYERAVEEFERDRRVSPIREVTLDDEGVAGERFDAESQLLVTLEMESGRAPVTIASSVAPTVGAPVDQGLVVRVVPNTYRDRRSSQEPPSQRFAPATARIYFGRFASPSIRRVDGEDRFEVVVSAPPGTATRSVVVIVTGNESLLADVLERANWKRIRALIDR